MSDAEVRLCKNPECREPIDPERVEQRDAWTCNSRCRAAAWKAEVGYGRPSPSGGVRTGENARSGVSVSYRKAVNAVASVIPDPHLQERVVQALRDALPARQRQTLDEREAA